MRRSPWLVAAACGLLLGACAEHPPAKVPHSTRSHARSAKSAPGARAAEPAGGGEPYENMGESGSRGASAPTGSAAPPTLEQLTARYRNARPVAVLLGSGSYYGDSFAGRPTASGAPYEPSAFTAAHRSLPFGTVLRVTRIKGGQSVYVRVTDRGPYGPRGRILDLSRAAAEHLGMLRAGVAELRVEVLEYGVRKARRRKR